MKHLAPEKLSILVNALASDIRVDHLIAGFEPVIVYLSEKYHQQGSLLIKKKNDELDQQLYAIIDGFIEVLASKPSAPLLIKALYQSILYREPKLLFSLFDIRECYRLFYEEINEQTKQVALLLPELPPFSLPTPPIFDDIISPHAHFNHPLFQLIDQCLDNTSKQARQAIHLKGSIGKSFALEQIYRYLKLKGKAVTYPIHGLSPSFLEEIQCASDQKLAQIDGRVFLLNALFSQARPLILLIDDLDWLSKDNALNLSLVLEKSDFPVLLIFTAEYLMNQYSFLIKKSFTDAFTEYPLTSPFTQTTSTAGALASNATLNTEASISALVSEHLGQDTTENALDRYMLMRQKGLEKQHFIPMELHFELVAKLTEQITQSELVEQLLQATVMLGEVFPLSVISRGLGIHQSILKAQLDFLGFRYMTMSANEEYYRFGSDYAWLSSYFLLRKQQGLSQIDFQRLAQEIDAFYGEEQREYSMAALKNIARYLNQTPYEWIGKSIPSKALPTHKLYLALNTLGAIIAQKQSLLWTRMQVIYLSKYLAEHAYQWDQVKESLAFLQIGVLAAKQSQDYQSLIFLLMRSAKFYLLVQMPEEAIDIVEHIKPLLLKLKETDSLAACSFYRIEALIQLKLLLSAFNEINLALENTALPKIWQIRLLIKKSALELCFEQALLSRQTIQHAERLFLLLPAKSDPQAMVEFALFLQYFWVELNLKNRKKIEGLIKKLNAFHIDQFLSFIYHSQWHGIKTEEDHAQYQAAGKQIKQTQYAHLVIKLQHAQILGIFEGRHPEIIDKEEKRTWGLSLVTQLQALSSEAKRINDALEYISLQKSILGLKSDLIKSQIEGVNLLSEEAIGQLINMDEELKAWITDECDQILKLAIELIGLSQDFSLPMHLSELKLGEQALFQKNRFSEEISFAFDLLYRLNTEEALENKYIGIKNEAQQ